MNKPQTIIPLQTTAETDIKSVQITGEMWPVTIIARGLQGAEVVPVFFSVDDEVTFETVFQEGAAVELTATNKVVTINSPMRIGVTKPTTAGQAGVFLAFKNKA